MQERVIDVVPGLAQGRKHEGRSIYDRRANQDPVLRQDPDADLP